MQMATFMKANDVTTKLKEKEFTYTTTGLSTKATEKMTEPMDMEYIFTQTEQNTKAAENTINNTALA